MRPTAKPRPATRLLPRPTATTDGSSRRIPSPGNPTRVELVPRSIARSVHRDFRSQPSIHAVQFTVLLFVESSPQKFVPHKGFVRQSLWRNLFADWPATGARQPKSTRKRRSAARRLCGRPNWPVGGCWVVAGQGLRWCRRLSGLRRRELRPAPRACGSTGRRSDHCRGRFVR